MIDKRALLQKYAHSKGEHIVFIRHPENYETLEEIQKIKEESDMKMGEECGFFVLNIAKTCTKLKGDFAEVGVYKGGSAKLISLVKGNRPFWVCDTFEGLPFTGNDDALVFAVGQYKATEEEVEAYLYDFENINFVKGVFPSSGFNRMKDKKFAFVHLDVDVCQSIQDSLDFFYPRMVKGGMILIHDFYHVGMNKTIRRFFEDKEECIIDLFTSQALVVKVYLQ